MAAIPVFMLDCGLITLSFFHGVFSIFCWIVALSLCHFFMVFFLFFCLCQNFFYFSQSTDTFSKIDIHNQSNIF